MSKEKPVSPKKTVNRHLVPGLLCASFMGDYNEILAEFPEAKKLQLSKHLLECLDLFEVYISNPTKENWKVYADAENSFLKTNGKLLTTYQSKKMYLYFGDQTVLLEKEIYTLEQWDNLLPEEQGLSPKELAIFIALVKNSLYFDRDFLVAQQNLELEPTKEEAANGILGDKKHRLKREAMDKLTCLNQEQTVLLFYFLQQERFFLRDEYLSDREAGKAFEVLTGYSQHTIRNNIGKFFQFETNHNLKAVDNLLDRLKIAIDKTLKGK